MYLDDYDLIPNIGIKNIKIGMNYKDVEEIFKKNEIPYKKEIDNHERTDRVPWTFLEIENYMIFSFAKDILWKIDAIGNYKGKLKNGIKLGMKIDSALKVDNSLKFEDWEEIYISKNNYILEDECENNSVITMTIGIYEVFSDDSDSFYNYHWVERYRK